MIFLRATPQAKIPILSANQGRKHTFGFYEFKMFFYYIKPDHSHRKFPFGLKLSLLGISPRQNVKAEETQTKYS